MSGTLLLAFSTLAIIVHVANDKLTGREVSRDAVEINFGQSSENLRFSLAIRSIFFVFYAILAQWTV